MTEASCSNVMMYRDVQIGCTSSDLLKNNIHILAGCEISTGPRTNASGNLVGPVENLVKL